MGTFIKKTIEIIISIGLSSQWDLGSNMQRCPLLVIWISRRDFWSQKSSCLLRMQAIQQLSLSNGQTGTHLAFLPSMANPHSLRTCCNPFGLPSLVTIFWGLPQAQSWSSCYLKFSGTQTHGKHHPSWCIITLFFLSQRWPLGWWWDHMFIIYGQQLRNMFIFTSYNVL